MHEAGGLRSQPFLAALRSLAPRVTMQSEMRVVSGDVKERADILKGQIDGAESRFQVVITELQKERATQRQRLETELQAIHRLINFSMQQALHRGLKSAVAAVDALSAAKKSGRKARGTTASLPILNRRLRGSS